MLRLISRVAAIFSFVLLLAILFAWKRSTEKRDYVRTAPTDQLAISALSNHGGVEWMILRYQNDLRSPDPCWLTKRKAHLGVYAVVSLSALEDGMHLDELDICCEYTVEGWNSGKSIKTASPHVDWGSDEIETLDINLVTPDPRLPEVRRAYLLTPYWMLVVLASILPAVTLAKQVRRYRRPRLSRLSRCASCGYDLRATPGRCPECGTVPPAFVATNSTSPPGIQP